MKVGMMTEGMFSDGKALDPDTIAVCICTYKRPVMLAMLLDELQKQKTSGFFAYRVIVVDNDPERSAEALVQAKSHTLPVAISYAGEPRRNIALVRNKAMALAAGDHVAFIDDDETPDPQWLLRLYRQRNESQADAALGPVLPLFRGDPPRWLLRSGLCDRPRYPSGTKLSWNQTRTGNVLLDKRLCADPEARFLATFGAGGEDVDFFKRLFDKGYLFVWCDEAVVHEWNPPERWRASYLIKRAFLQGATSLRYSGVHAGAAARARTLAKSAIAFSAYTMMLPVLRVAGRHIFMRYLVKNVHHIGRLLALSGLASASKRNF
jgi:succinoglycan biosynthesis protein ExoM